MTTANSSELAEGQCPLVEPSFPPPGGGFLQGPLSNRACGFPAHGLRAVVAGRDEALRSFRVCDGSREFGQSEGVEVASVPSSSLASLQVPALAHDPHALEPPPDVPVDLDEFVRGVAGAEVLPPATQHRVERAEQRVGQRGVGARQLLRRGLRGGLEAMGTTRDPAQQLLARVVRRGGRTMASAMVPTTSRIVRSRPAGRARARRTASRARGQATRGPARRPRCAGRSAPPRGVLRSAGGRRAACSARPPR